MSNQKSAGGFFKKLGPGLITGAGDDDPSGIATYSQAGATLGLSTLWMALLTFPLMSSIQNMCARIGFVTTKGLAATLRDHYPRPILYAVLFLSIPATVLNIASDVAGMGAVSHMLAPAVPSWIFSVLFTVILAFFILRFSYQKIAAILKWLCLCMLLYIVVPFMLHIDWWDVLKHTLIPDISLNRSFIETTVAILGTTISPYLFFWQATMESEDIKHKKTTLVVDKQVLRDIKTDVNTGMFASNLVMYFIILTTGMVLHGSIDHIDTVDQAAKALEPLVGSMSYICFAVGVIGTGALAIPILAGSLSYITSETFNWKGGFDRKFGEAKGFYITLFIALLLGLVINFLGISPMKALIWTAVLYGITAPVMIVVILHICNNRKIMKDQVNSVGHNIWGIITLVLMTAAVAALIMLSV